MVSRELRCVFIHIPKCAGTSIERSLGMHADGVSRDAQDHRRFTTLERSIWPPERNTWSPIEFAHFFKKRRIARRRGEYCPNSEELSSFFKFSIVRNPWSRVYSWYRNVIRDPLHRQTYDVSADCSFDRFLDRHLDCWALDPQLDWLTDLSGAVRMDYIGRFETLEDSFAEIREKLGHDLPKLPNLLVSGNSDYRSAYSDAAAERIARKYRQEIDAFGYEF